MLAMMIKIAAFAVFTCFAINPWAKSDEPSKVEFEQDVAPIFRQNCVACHNSKKAEGGLNLESYESLMAGGDSGAAITAGDQGESYVLPRITGEEEPWMPPDDNTVGARRLTSEEVELIREWIQAGALAPQTGERASIQWGSLPENLRPVYAMATSPDGQYLAFGRGNSVTITSLASALQADQQPLRVDSLVDVSLLSPTDNSAGEVEAGEVEAGEVEASEVEAVKSKPVKSTPMRPKPVEAHLTSWGLVLRI